MAFSNLTPTFVLGKITLHTKLPQTNVNNLKRTINTGTDQEPSYGSSTERAYS